MYFLTLLSKLIPMDFVTLPNIHALEIKKIAYEYSFSDLLRL